MVTRKSSSIFITCEGKILLLLRDDNEKIIDPGVWAPVSGTIEQQENEEECVQREVLEELELELTPTLVKKIGTHIFTVVPIFIMEIFRSVFK